MGCSPPSTPSPSRAAATSWPSSATAREIAANFDVTRSAISQHVGVLKHAGLVTERREGTKRLYRARPEGLAELRAFLDEFWSDRLDVLVREAQREERRRKRDRGSSN